MPENLELAQRTVDAMNRRDLDAFLALMDEEVEAVPQLVQIEGSFHGHDGIRRWWDTFVEVWPDVSAEIAGVRAVGDVTYGTMHLRAHGAGSDIPSNWTVCSAARWREGKCIWWGNFRTADEALAAVGLSGAQGSQRT